MKIVTVGLQDGKITFRTNGTVRAFDPKNVTGMAKFLSFFVPWHLIASSSLNHPGNYGFPKRFNAHRMIRQVVELAYREAAVWIPPEAVVKVRQRIKKEVKKRGLPLALLLGKTSPIALLLGKTSPKDKDDLVVFSEITELDAFLAGLEYAEKLASI